MKSFIVKVLITTIKANQAGDRYTVSDVLPIPSWNGEEYPAMSVKIIVTIGVVTVTLRISEKKSRFKV